MMFSRLQLSFLTTNDLDSAAPRCVNSPRRRRSRNYYIFFAAHRSARRRQRACHVVELQRRSSRTALKDFSASIYYVMSCLRTRPPQHGRENQSRKRWQAVIASKIESSDGSMKRKERHPVECTTDSIDVRKFQIHLSDLFLNCIIFMNSRTYILKCPFLLGATTSPVDESSLRQVGQFFVLFISGLGEG